MLVLKNEHKIPWVPTLMNVLRTCVMKYEVLPKISENFLVIKRILTLSHNFHRHLRSSHLGLYTTIPAILPFLEALIEVCRR